MAWSQSVPAVTRLPAPGATATASSPAAPNALPPDAALAPAPVASEPMRLVPRRQQVADAPAPPEPGEFERLAAEANGGRPVWRFGSQMRRGDALPARLETPARVPPHYVVQVGDELTITVWGSVDAEWRLRVDRAGRVSLPRVGPVPVAGASAGELDVLLRARLERVFRGFDLSAAVTDVTPLRVHITGFVERPGAYVVPGLSTISSALAVAQGPAAGGSFRRVRLLRDGATVTVFDLYALLGAGERRDDRMLQPDDVLHVEAAGPQAALVGSVKRPAVFEFLPGETVADLLRLAGGFSPVAERNQVAIERMDERRSIGARALSLPRDAATPLGDGDIVVVNSVAAPAVPTQTRNKRVRVEGEVARPGDYVLAPQATLADAVALAGGPTASAFLFGTSLTRERVRVTQEANYERALQELEADIARAAQSRTGTSDAAVATNDAAARQLLARLRARRPDGRMVLDITPEATDLPHLELEDGDVVLLPPRGQSVGVFGSVFNPGSFVHGEARDLGHYIARAGGSTANADYDAVFVVRANGSVLSARQGGSWAGTSRFEREPALPGDTVFVPEQWDRTTWVQGAKDWTQILYQFGIGIAALLAIR